MVPGFAAGSRAAKIPSNIVRRSLGFIVSVMPYEEGME